MFGVWCVGDDKKIASFITFHKGILNFYIGRASYLPVALRVWDRDQLILRFILAEASNILQEWIFRATRYGKIDALLG